MTSATTDTASTTKTGKPPPWTDRRPRAFGELEPQQYIAERINNIRAWYDKEASKAKRNYLWMRGLTVVGSAVVPVLINIQSSMINMTLITTFISLIVVILVSLESVMHFREQWKGYRSTEQTLEREYYHFVAAEGAYRGMDEKKAFLEFVDRIEGAIAAENASTLSVMTTANDQARPTKAVPGAEDDDPPATPKS
jgi:hypothetical protein